MLIVLKVIAFNLLENNTVLNNLSEIETYRGFSIYQNNHYKIPTQLFNPQPNFATLVDNYLLLSNKKEALQNTIASFQNQSTLEYTKFHKTVTENALRKAHINLAKNNSAFINELSKSLNDKSISKVNLIDFPLFIQQINYEDNYINVNILLNKATKENINLGVSQIASVELEAEANPNLFNWVKNHNNNTYELLVQDTNNKLYLINQKGQVLWKKELSSTIQGRIQEVDLFKNNKIQFAFTTKNEFMILDRNGNQVDSFYKEYNNNLKPLSVFDYDKNRNYRFLISHDNNVEMYDNKMKLVSGFEFNKTKSDIVNQPQHIRIGTKDYIIVAEEKGKLHILDRRGKDRTKVKQKFTFAKNEKLIHYKGSIYFKDNKNYINKINIATGKSELLDQLKGSSISYNKLNGIDIKLEDQKLNIKNNSYELEYGTYTKPEVFYQDKKYYITTTNTGKRKSIFI